MGTVIIEEVLSSENWKGRDGTAMTSFEVKFDGEQAKGIAWMHRPTGTPGPKVGESFDGEVAMKGGKQVLKKVKAADGYTPRSNNSSGKTGDFRSPAQIMRGDAHGKALHWCDIKVAAGEWKSITWEQYIAMVDRFYDDLLDAGLKAELPNA